ncbi:helix-turn-helix domain-containing protein [Rhodococcus sp. HM1]|uniref:helix-turn-helix domain-containing protein n=1 Tax=Rhodococcus sp. HM1 TaxID=2937759 RepID=UPI00200AD880|nr:helix-turn-helix transcriptional regulator [Rhodococcus sp. HM1]MCK8671023.1 helix-turn-helix domain-containing protein [Rhodococcus sp. HM1]
MGTQRVDLGPTGEAVAANIARMRSRSGLTLRQLAARISDAGRPISHTTLSQIEAYSRRVTVDELVAIAAALDVTPSTLLMPHVDDASTEVEASGVQPTTAFDLWRWVTAQAPHPLDSEVPVDVDWLHRTRPLWTFRQMTDDELRDALVTNPLRVAMKRTGADHSSESTPRDLDRGDD